MIRIIEQQEKEFNLLEEISPHTWVDLFEPTEDEMKIIAEKTKIDIDDLYDCLDEFERPRAVKEEDYLYILIKAPVREHLVEGEIQTFPIGIFITHNYFITVHKKFPKLQENTLRMRSRSRFSIKDKKDCLSMHLFSLINQYYLHVLNQLEKKVEFIEDQLLESHKIHKGILETLTDFKRTLVYFNSSIFGNNVVLTALSRGRIVPLSEEFEELLDDVEVDALQLLEMTQIIKEILTGTLQAYDQQATANLNRIMKILTVISTTLAFPTFITSFYGMNISLPFDQDPLAYIILFILSFGIGLISIGIFWKKGYL